MARTRASFTCSIWTDPDFRQLDADAQRVYFLLLSQPKLTLAGCLDYMPARWASLAADDDVERLERAVAVLERARYVMVDRDTEELVIRTFVRHDVGDRANKNTVKGMWSAWAAIMSAPLRRLVLEHVPEKLWQDAPTEAATMRDEPPSDPPSTPPNNHRSNDGPNDRSDDGRADGSDERANLPLSALRSPLPSSSSPASKPTSTHEGRARQACRQEADRRVAERIASGEDIPSPGGLARTIARDDLWPVLGNALLKAAEGIPDAAPGDLLALVGTVPSSESAADPTSAAAEALYERNHERREALAAESVAPPPSDDLASARAALREKAVGA